MKLAQRKKFRPHQTNVFRLAKRRSKLALFLDMRLGKTLLAIRWAASRPRSKRVLILCPLSVVPVWEAELRSEGHVPCTAVGPSSKKEAAIAEGWDRDATFYVTNPEAIVNSGKQGRDIASIVARLPWDTVIIDESTCIKSPRAKITKVALKWLAGARYRCILSGLPDPEGAEDLVCQLFFVLGGQLMGCRNYWDWRRKHMQVSYSGWCIKPKAEAELRRIAKDVGIIMTRQEVKLGGSKVYETRHVTLPAKVYSALRTLERNFQVGTDLTNNALEQRTWMTQLTGGIWKEHGLDHNAKVNEVVRLARGELSNQPLLVWCRYNDEVAKVANALKKFRRVYAITGDISSDERVSLAQKVKTGKHALVVQTKCLDRGVDLSHFDTAIYYSNYWSLDIRGQSEDRLISVSKTWPSLIIDIVAKDTVDEDALSALKQKCRSHDLFMGRIMQGILNRRKGM